MAQADTGTDHRLLALRRWLREWIGDEEAVLEPVGSDASFRRYFRLCLPGGTAVAMDAPPAHEDCRRFVRVAALLHEAGLNAPEVLAQDTRQGFLLLSDLGRERYLDALDARDARDAGAADALFDDAIAALVRWQLATRPGALPPYDEALLRRELELFRHWYVERHLGMALDSRDRGVWRHACELLIDRALSQPRVFVHRDYIPRNLMTAPPRPGVLDMQDAVIGPVCYDMVSLLRDAFISWDHADEWRWLSRYRERAGAAGVPVPADHERFRADVDWLGAQRHLKVIGIFSRLHHRDGKSRYLAEIPRFFSYLRRETGPYRELGPLDALLRRLSPSATGGP